MTRLNGFLSCGQTQEITIFGHLNLAFENFIRTLEKDTHQAWKRKWGCDVIQQQIRNLSLLRNFSSLHGRGVVVGNVF